MRKSRAEQDWDGLSKSLGNQAVILYARGDLDRATRLYQETERICRELGNKDGLQITLGNQALILKARGDLDGAMRLHQEGERICRELGNKDSPNPVRHHYCSSGFGGKVAGRRACRCA